MPASVGEGFMGEVWDEDHIRAAQGSDDSLGLLRLPFSRVLAKGGEIDLKQELEDAHLTSTSAPSFASCHVRVPSDGGSRRPRRVSFTCEFAWNPSGRAAATRRAVNLAQWCGSSPCPAQMQVGVVSLIACLPPVRPGEPWISEL